MFNAYVCIYLPMNRVCFSTLCECSWGTLWFDVGYSYRVL